MEITDTILQNPSFVCLSKNATFDLNHKENIYYFHNYFNWGYVKDFDVEDNRRKCTTRVLDFKNENNTLRTFGYYNKCVQKVEDLNGEWIVCSIPGHAQVYSDKNTMNTFLRQHGFPGRFKLAPGLILRTAQSEEKHGDNFGRRIIDKDLRTLTLSTTIVKDKNVIVFDDVTTSGTALSRKKT